jgi:hypothetical protein
LNADVIKVSCPWEHKFIPLKIPNSNLWKVASSKVKYGAKGNCDIVEVRMDFKLLVKLQPYDQMCWFLGINDPYSSRLSQS